MGKKHSALALFALIFLVPLIFATKVRGQTTTSGSIVGTITDPTGASVPSARVILKDLNRGATKEATTNKEGSYRFDLLSPGRYTLTIAASGFQKVQRDVQVAIGQVTAGDITLTLGSATETVTVSGESPLLNTEEGNVSSTISELQAANIPNPGNDITYMAQIAPGSVMNTAGGGLGNFSSYGISAVANLFTVNGMDDNDPFLNVNNSGATNLTLGQNEIQEVAVVTNGYSGQYGGLAGANINYITRGGTNQFHGRATWYWNGTDLNANNWFHNATNPVTPRSFVNANQYGADLGGPIVKDKLFFYVNFEGLYLVVPTSNTVTIPSPGFASATLANLSTQFGAGSQVSQFYQNMFKLYAGAPGAAAATPVPGGGCDKSLGDLPALAALNFGAANPCALTFQSAVSNKTHEHLEAYRIDWNVTKADRFFGRIQHDRGLQASFTDPINSLFNVQSDQPEWQGQASESHTFSSGAVNQFVASGQWYSAIFGNANLASTLAAFPTNVFFVGPGFTSLGGINFNFPQGRRVTQFQISDDFSLNRGAHTFKVGLKFRRNWVSNTDYTILSGGQALVLTDAAFFNGGFVPVAAGAKPNGDTTDFTQAFPTAKEQPFAVYTLGGYGEDDWKVKPNLTLTLSLRLDHPSNAVCFRNCFALPAAPFPSLSADPNVPYNQLMNVGLHQQLPDLTSLEWQPRFGFAWQPHFMANTVVRGGVGIFYDAFPGGLLDNFSENPPLDPQFTVAGLHAGDAGLLSSAADPRSLFSNAAASNAAFQAAFGSGGSFNSISSTVPAFAPPNLASAQAHPKAPQYQKWSLEIEHQFGQNTSVTLQYVGNHALHIFTENAGINGCNFTGTATALPACNATSGFGVNPNFGTVLFAESIGVSNYNGMTASFTHRYKSGLVQVNYTWSHAFDTVSDSGIPQDAFGNTSFGATVSSIAFPEIPSDPHFNYASSDYDARHTLNANYVWELPVKRYVFRGHGPDRLLNGWNVNGDVFYRTGFPFTIVDGGTTGNLQGAGYGSAATLVEVFGSRTAAGGSGVNCASTFPGVAGPPDGFCLNPAAFTNSPTGAGNLGRNAVRGPYYWNSDFSLLKHTKIRERTEFVFGAQFFNVFNHPNFDLPVNDVANAKFGQILKTVSSPTTMYGSGLGADASPRIIQLKLQFLF